ncbi:MAG: hypothetical protein AABY30_01060, partial [Candidatus Thermoplasmatota archaeon]
MFRQEFLASLKSVRFLIMALVAALVIVGGSYGISGLAGGFGGPRPLYVWLHPAFEPSGDHIAVAWVADPFGGPVPPGETVVFQDLNRSTRLGEAPTDANGFARLNVGNVSVVGASVRMGTFEVSRLPAGTTFRPSTSPSNRA